MKNISKRAIVLIAILFVITAILLTVAHTTKAGACRNWFCFDGSNTTYITDQQAMEQNQKKLIQVEPIPYLNDSEERKNLIKRAKTFNDPNRVSYIALYSWDGKMIRYDTVKGKVSSVDSSLTAQQQVLDSGGNVIDGNSHWCSSSGCSVVNAPAVDGSYGTNGAAIFYYNENGAYQEWNGLYFLSTQPMTPVQQPDLVKQAQ